MPQAFTTTFVLWTGDGNTTQFSFPFQYQRPEDVFVEVDGNPVPTVLVTSNTVQVLPAPAMNARIRIFRSTPVQEPANQFQLGAPFLPANIDENFEQSLFVLQEGLEIIDEQVKFIDGFSADVTTAVSLLQAEVSGFEADLSTLQTEMSGVEADLLTLQGQHDSLAASAIRAPVGESVPALPPAAQRIGKIMGFDGAGDPVLLTGSDASSLAAALADWNQGGNLVGYDATRTVTQAIDEALAGFGVELGTAAQADLGTGPDQVPTNADLGTAAQQNIGTSGANVPLLNSANVWTGAQTVQNADIVVESNNYSAVRSKSASDTAGPLISTMRSGGSLGAETAVPDGGLLCALQVGGHDGVQMVSNAAWVTYTARGAWSPSNRGGQWDWETVLQGQTGRASRMSLHGGLWMAGAAGADKGPGSVNAQAVYENGVRVGTLNVPHTWAVAGEVKVPVGDADVIPGFFVPTLAPGQTVKLVEARHVIGSGTSATVTLRRNGVNISGFTGMSATQTATLANPADVALAAGDYIQPVVTGVNGSPQNLTLTIALEYGRA